MTQHKFILTTLFISTMALSLGAFNMTQAATRISNHPGLQTQAVIQKEDLKLETNWDKVFPQSDKVTHSKVTFVNRYGITLAADMYVPKDATSKLPALAVAGPFGAVKEQSSGLYAQEMAERGFLTIAFDPSYTGESGGQPRYIASPDINTEDYQAAVDFLMTQDNVDAQRVGIIGICGWGGIALNAAALDTRIKATAAMTMYDMTRVIGNGYFDEEDNKQARMAKRQALNEQRLEDFKAGQYALGGAVPDTLPDDAPYFVKDYFDYYKTDRGYHPRSLNSNGGWNATGTMSFLNARFLDYVGEIDSAVMLVHGDKAHSYYMSVDAHKLLRGKNQTLVTIKGASHTDLYDQKNIIPFGKLENFFKDNLK